MFKMEGCCLTDKSKQYDTTNNLKKKASVNNEKFQSLSIVCIEGTTYIML